MQVKRCWLLGAVALMILCGGLGADELGKFEKDATQPRVSPPEREERSRERLVRQGQIYDGDRWLDPHPRLHDPYGRHDSHDRASSDARRWFDWTSGLEDVMGALIGSGFAQSMERVRPGPSPLRDQGDPLVPFVRFDGAFQDVTGDVEAWDFYAQLGYGPVAIDYRKTRYCESRPHTQLDMDWVHGVSRLSYGSMVEVDLGLGLYTLHGDRTTHGFSWTSAVLIYPTDRWGVELRPSVAHLSSGATLRDYDIAVHVREGVVGAKVGYRWVTSPNVSLEGPYVGMVFRW